MWAGHGRGHLALRERPIQQRLPGESLTQHRPVPTEVVAEIPGRHTTAPPHHQPLNLAVVCVHPPEPEAQGCSTLRNAEEVEEAIEAADGGTEAVLGE